MGWAFYIIMPVAIVGFVVSTVFGFIGTRTTRRYGKKARKWVARRTKRYVKRKVRERKERKAEEKSKSTNVQTSSKSQAHPCNFKSPTTGKVCTRRTTKARCFQHGGYG